MPLPVQMFEPDPSAAYTIETVSRITRIPRHTIAVYCRHRLVSPVVEPEIGGWFFDEQGIRTLRRIEQLRRTRDASLGAIEMIFALARQIEELEERLQLVRE
jgi:DNA-binding transcriptional MerR regulator